ncbi:MAG: hypothetical protein EA370_15015 [Wenzhouxiangella sp.]|nr:MAG: hypothetical protein EA370_15015 [Wenzhouxiangella sp.]
MWLLLVLSVVAQADAHQVDQAEAYFRSAQDYAEAEEPVAGLEMARRAVELEPDNPDYLEAQGNLAGWLGQGQLAIESFERALELSPQRTWLLLSLGLQKAWAGQLDQGADLVRQFLETHPERIDAMLHLVDFEIWRGNYAGALRVLDDYRELAGEDRAYLGKRARILAWLGRRDAAMEILDALLAEEPDNPDLHYSRTLALRDTRPEPALESLAVVEREVPGASDTIDLARSTRLPLRSRVFLELDAFRDSDSIRTRSATLGASHHFSPLTRVDGALQRRRWEADPGSGLEPEDGSDSIDNTRYRLGLGHRLGPDGSVELHLGQNDIERVDRSWFYGVGARWRVSDEFALGLAHDKDLFAISPRTVFNRLERRATRADLDWRPGLSHHVNLTASYQGISDDNSRRALAAAYRYDWIRSQNWNVDLSAAGGWVSFQDNPNTGYYAPSRYRFAGVGFLAYWKISDDDGIGLNYGIGLQKDETFGSAKVFHDVTVDAVFGIFRDWMLRLSAGYSDRQNQAGGFDARVGSIRLERRF